MVKVWGCPLKSRDLMSDGTGGSSRRFWGGGPTGGWLDRRVPLQGTPKTENSTDLVHYFLGLVQIQYLKKIIYINKNKILL